MRASQIVKVLAFILAGGVALALLLEFGSRSLGWRHGASADADRGPPVKQVRSVEAFDAIELRSKADIDVTVGGPQTVTVESDAHTLSQLDTRVEGHTLMVDAGDGIGGSGGGAHVHFAIVHDGPTAHITITVPALTALRVLGAGRFVLHQLKGPQFAFEVKGAGMLVADGAVDALTLDLKGAGKVDTSALQAKTVDVTIGGAGSATVWAKDAMTARVEGIGRVIYLGNPPTVVKRVSGLGMIRAGTADESPPPG
jgi:hypothetical protein